MPKMKLKQGVTRSVQSRVEETNCDFSPLKEELKERLRALQGFIERTIDAFDEEDNCMLGEFELIRKEISETGLLAGTFYLRCYLSSFTDSVDEISKSVRHLSERRHGALMVVERNEMTTDLVTPGIAIDAAITHSLLESIFVPGTPLHDGAVILRMNKIVSAASVLPLSVRDSSGRKLGTRHRAALGLTERCDALVIVVSEETGRASFAIEGRLYPFATGVAED